MKLPDRMEKILALCGRLGVWADIGCDHGRVSAELVLRSKAQRVIACDVSELSLYKAKDLSASLGLKDKMECRLGDGLSVLQAGEAQGLVIAGMGTPLIIKILAAGKSVLEGVSELVLSANNYHDRLRRWLYDNGFVINSEVTAFDDGRFYPIMHVIKGEGSITEQQAYTGINPLRDENYINHIKRLINREEQITTEIELNGGDAAEHKRLLSIYREAVL